MRSRTEVSRRLVFAALALSAAISLHAQSPETTLPVADGKSPTTAQVSEAVAKVKADPNLTSVRKISMLKWADSPDKKPKNTHFPSWLGWIVGLFAWLAQSGRVLVWIVAAALVGMLIIYIVRLLRGQNVSVSGEKFVAPSHVRDLDIRPESLPDDIGRAARELWDRGEHRAALALLYRGLLSRLVHVYSVPIRDSSTEGDCLALAVPYLNEARMNYASRLVRVWQRAVYGGEQVEDATVHSLCDEFASAMDAGPQPAAGIAGAAEQPA